METIEKVSILTLGCRSNQYDSSAIEDLLKAGGIDSVPFPSPADAYIINTCTVTKRTDAQSRQLVRRVRGLNPEAIVIVTGCYAQVSPEELKEMPGVDYIVGNPDKDMLLRVLKAGRQSKGPKAFVSDFSLGTPLSLRARSSSGRTRANLKIQDGCGRNCSYCIIPKARGSSKSLPPKVVLEEIEALISNSFKEIVLTGIHLGAYGEDLSKGHALSDLLMLIEEKGYPCRFRLSSIDPDEITDGMIGVLKCSKAVCRHLHLPLQSGDDGILRKMRRSYKAEEFLSLAKRLCSEVPDIAIGTDVMAGFPGEGEEEFENTCSVLMEAPIAYMHIFPYSQRKGTDAAGMPQRVSGGDLKKRLKRLKDIDNEKRALFYKRFLGRTAIVIPEAMDEETGLLSGRTDNYIPVEFKGDTALKNRLVSIRLTRCSGSGMEGVVLD